MRTTDDRPALQRCAVCDVLQPPELLRDEHEPGCPRAGLKFCACDLKVCRGCE